MMKKIIAVILAAALMLGCAAFAEEAAEKASFGTISINGAFTLKGTVPDGYKLTLYNMTQDEITAFMLQEDLSKPVMTLRIAFDETYADVERMNDLSDEEMAALEETYLKNDPTVELSYAETGYGTRLLVAKQFAGETDYLDFLSIYKGYFIEFAVTAGPAASATERNLPENLEQACIDFLTELDFIPAGDEAAMIDLAGKSFTADILDYNAEDNAIQATLKTPVTFTEEEVKALAVGETLPVDGGVAVSTVEEMDGSYLINDCYYLTRNADGLYEVSIFDYPVLADVGTVWAPLTESTVFTDGVDPETFEMLAEPVTKTAAEFLEIFQTHSENDVGFVSNNVILTFDADGNVAKIERIYTPWQ